MEEILTCSYTILVKSFILSTEQKVVFHLTSQLMSSRVHITTDHNNQPTEHQY